MYPCVCVYESLKIRANDDDAAIVAGCVFTVPKILNGVCRSLNVYLQCLRVFFLFLSSFTSLNYCIVHTSATLRRISCDVIKINLDKKPFTECYSTVCRARFVYAIFFTLRWSIDTCTQTHTHTHLERFKIV